MRETAVLCLPGYTRSATLARLMATDDKTKQKPAPYIPLALLIGGIAFLIWLFVPLLDLQTLFAWVKSSGHYVIPLLILLMIAHNFVPIPAEMIALTAGAVLGTVAGAATIWVGAMLGAILAFAMARYLGRNIVEKRLDAKLLDKVDRIMEDQGTVGLLFARFTPLISFNLVNYAAGLTGVSWGVFLATTAVGILPITLISTYAGAHMLELGWPTLITLSIIAVIGFFLVSYVRKQSR